MAKAILLCSYALQDKADRWSLMGVFEKALIPSVPGPTPAFFIFVRIADCPKVARYMFQMEDPAGIVIWSSGAQVLSRSDEIESAGWDIVWAVPPATVTEFGKHRVSVYVNADRVVDTDLVVAPFTGIVAKR